MACYDAGDYTCTYDSGDVGAGCGGGGCDYSSFITWEEASDNDLSGTGITPLDCYDSQNHDVTDYINGATNTDNTHYRVVRSSASCSTPFAGKANTGANFVFDGAGTRVFRLAEGHARLENLCISYDGTNAGQAYGVELTSTYCKAISVVIYDCTNNTGGQTSTGLYGSANGNLIYNCIVYGSDYRGIQVGASAGETIGAVCCTAIDNADHGFASVAGDGTAIVFSCYAADNPNDDFDQQLWDAPSGWNSSKDLTSDLGGTAGDNYKNSNDLTDTELDADYLALESIDWAGGAGDNAGRNPYNDVTATTDFDGFLWAGASEDPLFPKDIAGNARPNPHSADEPWDVGASEFIAPPTTLPPTTLAPTTLPTTAPPTTAAPTTLEPTEPPTTLAPTTLPTTSPPTTLAPTTLEPTTLAPTTLPTTAAPTSLPPTTLAPTTLPTTAAPTSLAPTTLPTTVAATTLAPTTVATTAAPTTTLTTLAPTTIAPTIAPTTAAVVEACIIDLKSPIARQLNLESSIVQQLNLKSPIAKYLNLEPIICRGTA